MKINTGPSVYIPTDKNIFDGLQHRKVSHKEVFSFLRQRGIIVSSELDKGALSKIIAQLTFDYHDYLYLTKLLENPNRKEKTTWTTIKASTVDSDSLINACQGLADEAGEDESYKIVKKEGSTVLVVTYTDIDFTKTELRQRSVKSCELELKAESDLVSIRKPATKKGYELAKRLEGSLSIVLDQELEQEEITLANIISPELRSKFFIDLIKAIPNYRLEDVSSVNINHNIDESMNLDSETETDSNGYAGFINRAALAGGGVLESAEFNQLHSRGFFVSKIIWTVVDEVPGGDKLELEAQFGEPSSCSDFKYLVRGVYNYNERMGTHIASIRRPSREETGLFNGHLERAAKLSYEGIIKDLAEVDDDAS